MSYAFRPAIKSEAKPLVGLYSESGCGKTLSALYLARGFAGSGRVGMIETEAGRGEAYASTIPGGYDVLPLRGSFSPREYGEAIEAAENAGLAALIIDSASHEWEAIGGVLHMAARNQEKGTKGVLVWQQPKMDHQRHFVQRLISTPIPLVVVCMRAKYPMKEVRKTVRTGSGGDVETGQKEWVRSDDLEPTQSENILFEMFMHGWIDREHKFHGTKYTLDELRAVLRDGEPISIATGERLGEWARGGAVGATQSQSSITTSKVPERIGTDAAASANGGPSPESDERTRLLTSIDALAAELNLSKRDRADGWNTYVGRGISRGAADVTGLADLLKWLRTRDATQRSERKDGTRA